MKPVPVSIKLYVLQRGNTAYVFCSLSYSFYFVGDKIAADFFKYKITPLLKSNERLTIAQDVTMKYVREKGKPRWKSRIKTI